MKAMQNPDEVGAAAVDYLYFKGICDIGIFLGKHGAVLLKLAEGSTETAFYNAKITTARFYFSRFYLVPSRMLQ